jgi:hypothetical protein
LTARLYEPCKLVAEQAFCARATGCAVNLPIRTPRVSNEKTAIAALVKRSLHGLIVRLFAHKHDRDFDEPALSVCERDGGTEVIFAPLR